MLQNQRPRLEIVEGEGLNHQMSRADRVSFEVRQLMAGLKCHRKRNQENMGLNPKIQRQQEGLAYGSNARMG